MELEDNVFQCPSCGGDVEYSPEQGNLKCPYCDTEFDIDALKAAEELLKRENRDEFKWEDSYFPCYDEEEGVYSYRCSSCGGEVVLSGSEISTFCPYCGENLICSGNISGTLKPDFIIPFKITKEEAKKALVDYYKDKPLLPDDFSNRNHIDEIKGIYVPFWLFDAECEEKLCCRAHRTTSWPQGDYIYTTTSYYLVRREGSVTLERVPVDGSETMPDELMESIEPFDFSEAVDYKTAYLAGFYASKYDVEASSSEERANERIKKTTEDLFLFPLRARYQGLSVASSFLEMKNGRRSYVLYPVWLLNTRYGGRTYTFAMNGQTGRFVGEVPVDEKKEKKRLVLSSALFSSLFFLFFFLISLIG